MINELMDANRNMTYPEQEILDAATQEYKVDNQYQLDPVGIKAARLEGNFLNILWRRSFYDNINNCFDKAGIAIAEMYLAPLAMADSVLNESEKRGGCVLVDLGADTTTLVVYKNNIVRYLVTIPLVSNNINKDLSTLPIDEAETEDVKLKYGDACQEFEASEESETQYYTTSDGRQIDVNTIKTVAESRMGEIIANVSSQIINSDYSGKLLAGIVITGGGSNMKNIVKAFTKNTKIDKVRVANKVNQVVVKTSNASNFSMDSVETTTIVSLLLAGTVPCGGEDIGRAPDIFDQQTKDEERRKRQEEAEAAAKAEEQDAIAFDGIKSEIRSAIDKVRKQNEEVKKYGSDKKVRLRAKDLSLNILDETIGEKYEKAAQALQGKDKFKQSLKEGADLAELLKVAVDELTTSVNKANKENSFWGRTKGWISDIVSEDNN
jgi:cell division protein FtsA